MYRALTWAAQRRGHHFADAAGLTELAHRLDIDIQPPTADDGRQYTVLIDGEDATWDLRQPEVDRNVSEVARHPSVREVMRSRQRAIGLRGQVVMVGRDIGTIVLPEAKLKVYLEASLSERAARRVAELSKRGQSVERDAVEAEVARRDELDSHVMDRAPDALVLSTDDLTPQEEVDVIVAQLREQEASG